MAFHLEGMTENEADAFSSAQIGQPVPGEEAFNADDDVLAEGTDRLEKGIGIGLHVAMKNDRAGLIENAEIHGSAVKINSAVVRMLLRIESHRGLLLSCRPSGTTYTFRMVAPSTKPALGGGLNQYHAAATDERRVVSALCRLVLAPLAVER